MAEEKKVKARVKFRVPAGKATPAPPVGSALGAHGVNMQEFINPFNDATRDLGNVIVPVQVTIYEDRSMTFTTKTPPVAGLIRDGAGVAKGSGVPHKDKVGVLSQAKLREIAEIKMPDLNANDIDAAMKVVAGTARSMGITIEGQE